MRNAHQKKNWPAQDNPVHNHHVSICSKAVLSVKKRGEEPMSLNGLQEKVLWRVKKMFRLLEHQKAVNQRGEQLSNKANIANIANRPRKWRITHSLKWL